MSHDGIRGVQIEEVKKDKPKQADTLIALAKHGELFHTPDETAFADLRINGHRETRPVRSRGFRRWLTGRFFEATGSAPNSEAMQSALNVIEAEALFHGEERPVYVRIAGFSGKIYLDLTDPDWRVVEVDDQGWRPITDPPVRFRRAPGMLPLPMPQPGGSIEDLRGFINIADERDFVLLVAWLVAALSPYGPYPVLVLTGEHGTAKSLLEKLLRALVDPNTVPLRSPARDDRDLFIAANNGHLIAFDNVSSLPHWLSDALCRIATGGGFATRQLYTDADESLFDAMRPVVLNGIEDFVTRPDLADRSVQLSFKPIPEHRRRPAEELLSAFEAARAQILGALLDGIVHGLRERPNIQLDRLPRMADFAIWVTACEGAFWPVGTFLKAYDRNRAEADKNVIEADAVATALCNLMSTRRAWEGFVATLLSALAEQAGETQTKAKDWPKSPRALSGRLRRAAPNLRRIGIDIIFGLHQAKGTPITVRADGSVMRPSEPSTQSSADRMVDFLDDGQLTDKIIDAPTVSPNSREMAGHDDDDGRDDGIPAFTGDEDQEWKF